MKTIGKFGKVAAVAGIAIGVGLFKKGFEDAAQAQEKVAQLDAVLKSTGGAAGMTRESLLKMAEGFEKTTKFSAESALEAQSMLLTFTEIGKETFPRATKAAADMATAMGTDMKAQSIALGKALNNPTKGISALTRVGVTFTDAQKESIKAMQESGDMAGAQTVILKELEKEFGGSAEAAGKTFPGQLERLKNSFGGVVESIAVKLLPVVQKFADWIIENMPTIQKYVDIAMTVIGDLFKSMKPIIDALVQVFKIGFGIVMNVFRAFSALFKGDWEGLWDAVKGIIKGFFNIFKTIGKALFGKLWEGIKEKWNDLKDWVTEKVEWIQKQWNKVTGGVKTYKETTGFQHASGLNYVPYDGYAAMLHRGEKIIPAGENKEQPNSYNIVINNPRPERSSDSVRLALLKTSYGVI
jgi:hypothetical protein